MPEKKNRVLNMPEFRMSDAVHSIRSLTVQITEHYQIFKMECFAKRIMPECRCTTRTFSGQGGGGRFVELGHFDKDFVKNIRKKAPQGNILELFLLDTQN